MNEYEEGKQMKRNMNDKVQKNPCKNNGVFVGKEERRKTDQRQKAENKQRRNEMEEQRCVVPYSVSRRRRGQAEVHRGIWWKV